MKELAGPVSISTIRLTYLKIEYGNQGPVVESKVSLLNSNGELRGETVVPGFSQNTIDILEELASSIETDVADWLTDSHSPEDDGIIFGK